MTAVWMVAPAWGRTAVSQVTFAQWAHLAGELAPRGIDLRTVIIADDDNLDIAREHGFDTVEINNDDGVGRKFNAGYTHAAGQGADWFVHIGSDNWLHPDAFKPILDEAPVRIVVGARIAFIDLPTGRLARGHFTGPHGVIPWLVPRILLEGCAFEPIKPERRMRGMDGHLVRGLRRTPPAPYRWEVFDAHDFARVDFKSATNIHDFDELAPMTENLDADPWDALRRHYPARLVTLARKAHDTMNGRQSNGRGKARRRRPAPQAARG